MSAYLEVNVKKIQELINFANKTVLGNFKNKITVVKGNGYGHDVNLIVPLAVKAGSSILAVARVDEGIEVRNILNKLKSKLPILCLGIIDECNYATCIKNDISVPIANLDQAKRVAKLNIKGLKVHWKLNTGMNRIGFKNTKDLLEAYKLIDKKNVIHYGIFSHIFDNDRLISMKTQFERFEGLMKAIPNWEKIPLRHIRATGGSLANWLGTIPKRPWETAARYGCLSFCDYRKNKNKPESFNTFRLVANVIQINNLVKNDYTGYDSKYFSKTNERSALIPIGWGDGLQRSFAKTGTVYINGKAYKPIGKMSMDSFAIKVDNSVKFGDKVYIFKDINHALTCIEDKTDLANIIAILCCLTKRIPRVPVKEFK